MKKALKIIGITLLSLLALIIVAATIVSRIIVTPSRLTPLASNVINKTLTCDAHLGRANLTIFRTFPQLGVDMDDVVLINPVDSATTDTLAAIEHLTVAVDAVDYLKHGLITVKGLGLTNGQIYLFTSASGATNYDIFPHAEKAEEKPSTFQLGDLNVDLHHADIDRLSVLYDDRRAGILAEADDLGLGLKGKLKEGDLNALTHASIRQAALVLAGDSALRTETANLRLKADVNIQTNEKQGKANVTLSTDSLLFALADISASLGKMQLKANGDVNDYSTLKGWKGAVSLDAASPFFVQQSKSPMEADADQLQIRFDGTSDGCHLQGTPSVSVEKVSFTMNDERLLDHAIVSLLTAVTADTTFRQFTFADGQLTLVPLVTHFHDKTGDLSFAFDGALALPDSTHTDIQAHVTTNHWDIPRTFEVLPSSIRKALNDLHIRQGGLQLDADAVCAIQDGHFAINKAQADVALDKIDGSWGDSIDVHSPSLHVTAAIPADAKTTSAFHEFASGTLTTPSLTAHLIGLGDATTEKIDATYSLSDILTKGTPFALKTRLAMQTLGASLDTITAFAGSPIIEGTLTTAGSKPSYQASVSMDTLYAKMGDLLTASTGALSVKGTAQYDKTKAELLDKWNPTLNVNLHDADATLAVLPLPVSVPHIQAQFTPGRFDIADSRFLLGQSDFCLKGDISNLDSYLDKTGLLEGHLDFSSEHTDVNEIMDLVSGIGRGDAQTATVEGALATDSLAEAEVAEVSPSTTDEPTKEDNPFMVPLGIDLTLRTDISTAVWNGFDFHHVGGKVTCRDGVLVMEELGFTTKAATMQLTAMYKSPRPNHLFMGMDFHLLNIDIDDLIGMVPAVDTVVPMLKSFSGRAQFHIAGESYLKSNYDLKLSTLRGAASIEGGDLTVLDEKTFGTIKKYLMTDKQTENRIDSVDIELSVFRDEVDLYPFRIRLGEYEAIVGGRHNINRDLDFDYHISVVDCPLPVRLGLDVNGTLDDTHFKLVKPKYTNLYRPEKRNEIQARSLELKKVINESLKANVKPIEYYDKE